MPSNTFHAHLDAAYKALSGAFDNDVNLSFLVFRVSPELDVRFGTALVNDSLLGILPESVQHAFLKFVEFESSCGMINDEGSLIVGLPTRVEA